MLEKIANGVWKLVLGESEELTPVKYRKFDINKAGLESLPQRDVVPEAFQALECKKTKRGIAVTLPMETT